MGNTEKLRDGEWLSEKAREMTDKEIAEIIGCSRANVAYWRKQHGIDGASFPRLRDPDWLLGELERSTQKEVADEIGCSQSAVSKWAERHR